MKLSKKLIAPLLSIVTFTALGVGSTYALFTNNSDVDIAITAGNVTLSADISNLNLYSADTTYTDGDPVPDTDAEHLGSYTGSYYFHPMTVSNLSGSFLNGGTAAFNTSTKELKLDKMTPGDKVTFTITVSNSSNVSIKVRNTVTKSEDTGLFDGLEVKFGSTKMSGNIDSKWQTWEEYAGDSSTIAYSVSVYLPITAGNDYQGKSCTLSFNVEAVQANTYTADNSYLSIANAALKNNSTKNNCPNDAVSDAITATGTTFDNIFLTRTDGKLYAWDRSEDQFVVKSADNLTLDDYVFTNAATSMTDKPYSYYLTSNSSNVVSITTNRGIDVGNVSGIESVNYTNSTDVPQNVVIRTNSSATTLTVNAPLDTVKHYGSVGILDLQQVASTSYFEYGSVAFVELTIGRIVLTEESDVEIINVTKKDENTYNNPIIADGGVLDENIPDIISRDQVTATGVSTELVQIQITDSNGNVTSTEQIYVYASGAVGSTVKTETQNVGISSTLGLIAIDTTGSAGEKAYNSSQKESKIDEFAADANSVVISEGETTNPVARIKNTGYGTLSAAISAAQNGDVVVLLKDATETSDITISKEIQLVGTNLGTDDNPDFTTITGNGYTTGNGATTGKSGLVINLGSVSEATNVGVKNLELVDMGNYGAVEVTSSNNSNVNVLIKNVICNTFYRMGISVHGGNVDIEDCTIDSHTIKASVGNGINFDGYGLSYNIKGKVTNCNITNSSQQSNNWVSGGIALWDNVELEIDNCNISNCNAAISPVGEGNKTIVTNTTVLNSSTGISVNKYLYEDAKTCEVELGSGNNFTCSSKAIYVGIGQGYSNNVKLNITGGSYSAPYALILSDYASYYGNKDAYNLNDYIMSGSSISTSAVFNGTIAILYDAYELSTYENDNYKVDILNNAGLTPEKVRATDCWYSNGDWNSGNGSNNKGLFLISDIFSKNWMGSGEGIKLVDDLKISGDITCQMTSGSFYFYFQGHELTGGKIILNNGVSVITDTSGKSSAFGGGTIIETDNGNGTYTYAIQSN